MAAHAPGVMTRSDGSLAARWAATYFARETKRGVMARKPLLPPRELFDQLREDLKTEADDIAAQPHLSTRQKLDRYLKLLQEFDAAWLIRLVRRGSAARTTSRDGIATAIAEILAAVTHSASLALVSVPKGVLPLGLTPDGNIAPLEYPDLPAKMKPARHLVEFPPARWEDQRGEALRWGDRDSARWGDEPVSADEARPMAERLEDWERQVAECVRREALARRAAEEIYRPHGLFEQAMPPNTLQDRVLFRWDGKYIERTLRHDLIIRAAGLLLNVMRTSTEGRQIPTSTRSLSRPVGVERINAVNRGRPSQRRRTNDRTRRSRELHVECDEALRSLGWSAHDWADKAKVSHTAIDRIMNGRTNRIRPSTRKALLEAMKEELEKRKLPHLLMKSHRWSG
jgi:hypothetical protein